jgi:hypothetical protein
MYAFEDGQGNGVRGWFLSRKEAVQAAKDWLSDFGRNRPPHLKGVRAEKLVYRMA